MTLAGHVHLGPVGAGRDRCRAKAGVAPLPQPGSSGRVVGDRAVFAENRFALDVAGHEHPVTAWAHDGVAVVIGARCGPAFHPLLGAVGGAVGHRGHTRRGSVPGGPGDEDRGTVAGHRYGVGVVIVVDRAVEASDPQLRAVRGAVGHRGVVLKGTGAAAAGAGHEHRRTVRGDRHGFGAVERVSRAVVARGPQPRASGGVVGHRQVIALWRGTWARTGHKHPAAARADRHRTGCVGAVAGVVVPLDPEVRARHSQPVGCRQRHRVGPLPRLRSCTRSSYPRHPKRTGNGTGSHDGRRSSHQAAHGEPPKRRRYGRSAAGLRFGVGALLVVKRLPDPAGHTVLTRQSCVRITAFA